jgi:membrane protease subunit (stomatin/prohibitin family)
MGVLNFAKKQFLDIVQWTESGDELLAWRFPTADSEIQQGGQLIVRETQMALFVDQGRLADLFGPGTHTMRTRNLPILTDLRHWETGFESPFKSEVYFFSTRRRLNQAWGTATPLTIRDGEFGAVRLRAYGLYSYRIADPRAFFTRVSGTREAYPVADLEGQLRTIVVAALTDQLGESRVPFLDLAASQDALAAAVATRARPGFADLGLALEALQIQNISLPDELQKRLDERIGMGMIGDPTRYTQFQIATSIPAAATADGPAGAGVGVGAGIGMGQTLAHAVTQAAQGTPPAATPAGPPPGPAGPPPAQHAPSSAPGAVCARCQARIERPSKFCPECGAALG